MICICHSHLHLHRFKRQRKTEHSGHKNCVLERGNTPAPCDTHDRGGGSGRTEDIEIDTFEIETFSAETEQPQDTITEETDDYYFQDPTTIGKNEHSCLHGEIEIHVCMCFQMWQCLVLIQY